MMNAQEAFVISAMRSFYLLFSSAFVNILSVNFSFNIAGYDVCFRKSVYYVNI